MLWIRRNLFLAVGGLLGVLLLAAGIVYFVGAQQRNKKLEADLEENKTKLTRLQSQNPYPSAGNIEAARRETERLRSALAQLVRSFMPVPVEKVTGPAFRAYRDNTLAELHRLAEQARTTLPSKGYAFSFETQKLKTEFKEGTFPAIPHQMAEVKALCKILFDAHVDPLVNVRRSRVSKDDDDSNVASDYHFLKIETNTATGSVISPYEVTFNCLTSDLAAVLQGLLQSRHGFVVKAIHVEPAAEAGAAAPGVLPPGPLPPGGVNPPRQPPTQPGQPPPGGRPISPTPAPGSVLKAGASDKPIILLKERRIKVTLLLYAIRSPK